MSPLSEPQISQITQMTQMRRIMHGESLLRYCATALIIHS